MDWATLGGETTLSKVFRFGLGSPARPLSLLWRVWAREDEVHVAVRTTEGDVEFTAYPTGRWRIAVGSVVSRWNRPKEFRPGWTRGPDLVAPHSAVAVLSPANRSLAAEPVAWLPAPAAGHLARFSLLFASPRIEENRWRPSDTPGTVTLAILPLRRAGAVHLCRGDEPTSFGEVPDALGEGSVACSVIVSADQTGRPSLWESRAPSG
jgi:hypothetical protein